MPILLGDGDISYWRQINKEVYKLYFKPVKVYKRINQEFDDIYAEDANAQFAIPYEIEAYLPNLPEWDLQTTKFGVDEVRDLRIFFSKDLLIERGVEFPDLGDHIVIQNDIYKVVQTNPVDFQSNIQVPMSHVVDVKRIHYENPDQGTTVFEKY